MDDSPDITQLIQQYEHQYFLQHGENADKSKFMSFVNDQIEQANRDRRESRKKTRALKKKQEKRRESGQEHGNSTLQTKEQVDRQPTASRTREDWAQMPAVESWDVGMMPHHTRLHETGGNIPSEESQGGWVEREPLVQVENGQAVHRSEWHQREGHGAVQRNDWNQRQSIHASSTRETSPRRSKQKTQQAERFRPRRMSESLESQSQEPVRHRSPEEQSTTTMKDDIKATFVRPAHEHSNLPLCIVMLWIIPAYLFIFAITGIAYRSQPAATLPSIPPANMSYTSDFEAAISTFSYIQKDLAQHHTTHCNSLLAACELLPNPRFHDFYNGAQASWKTGNLLRRCPEPRCEHKPYAPQFKDFFEVLGSHVARVGSIVHEGVVEMDMFVQDLEKGTQEMEIILHRISDSSKKLSNGRTITLLPRYPPVTFIVRACRWDERRPWPAPAIPIDFIFITPICTLLHEITGLVSHMSHSTNNPAEEMEKDGDNGPGWKASEIRSYNQLVRRFGTAAIRTLDRAVTHLDRVQQLPCAAGLASLREKAEGSSTEHGETLHRSLAEACAFFSSSQLTMNYQLLTELRDNMAAAWKEDGMMLGIAYSEPFFLWWLRGRALAWDGAWADEVQATLAEMGEWLTWEASVEMRRAGDHARQAGTWASVAGG